MTISTLDSHTSILIKERNRKKTRSEIFWTEIVLKRVAKLTSLGRTQDCLKKNDHQNQYLCIIWNFVSSVRSSSVYPCLSHTYIHTIHNQPLFQLFRLARVETLTAVSPNPKLRCWGQDFKPNFVSCMYPERWNEKHFDSFLVYWIMSLSTFTRYSWRIPSCGLGVGLN